MSFKHCHTNGRRGSILIYVTLAVPLLILPLMGLTYEVSVAHIVQAKLQAAVDGASLGAGRLLGTSANLEEIAGEFLQANFRAGGSGFFGAKDFTYTAHYTPGVVKTIKVSASVNVPTAFGRLLGSPLYNIPATATATRKDTRVVMVIDRSGSMSTLMPTLKNYAQAFAQKFNGSGVTGGSDELGLVAFDGSAVVGYPIVRPWDSTITATSTGGPDSAFEDGTSNDMLHQIAAITAPGNYSKTNTAEAIWLAYIELQKAHLRDLAAPGSGGVDQRLNAIVLFTDGIPTAVSLYFNNPADNATKQTGGTCTNRAVASPTVSQQMKAWLGLYGNGGNPPFSTSSTQLGGLDLFAWADTTHTANWWMTNNAGSGNAQDAAAPSLTPETGCNSTSGLKSTAYQTGASPGMSTTDLARIPSMDLYGNAMNTTGYTHSQIVGGSTTSVYNGTALNQTTGLTADYHWELAMWNAVDNAALNVRTDHNFASRTGDTQQMPVTIHVIAYTGNGGADAGLLKRVANASDSSSFSIAQPQGLYVPAGDSVALANAFNTVASSLLHLSR